MGVLVFKQVLQAGRIAFVCEKAASGRRWIIRNTEFSGQFYLCFAGPARNSEQHLAVHPSLFFRDGFGQLFGAQGAQNIPLKSGVFFNISKRRFCLGHGTLAKHFPAEKKIKAFFLHDITSKPKHQGMAVHARVHVLPVTTRWIF